MNVETGITQVALPVILGSGVILTAVHLARKPKLVLDEPALFRTRSMTLSPVMTNVIPGTASQTADVDVSIYLVRVAVRRAGKHWGRLKRPATNIEAYIESVNKEDNDCDSDIKSCSHQILLWHKAGGSATTCSRIDTEPRYFVLCQCTKQYYSDSQEPRILCQISNQEERLCPASYVMGLSISSENANKVISKVRLLFTGEWFEDEKEMATRGITASLIP